MLMTTLGGQIEALAASPKLEPGSGVFETNDGRDPGAPMKVYYHLPASWTPDSKIVLVLHGVKRNADRYRDNWVQHSEKYGFLVAAPEFTLSEYPGPEQYNLGNMFNLEDKPNPKSQWAYPVIERVFQEVARRSGTRRKAFSIFSHSAGAQFVHRMMLFARPPHVADAIAANAGWYTMPLDSEQFPYGLGGTGIGADDLRKAFASPLVIMAGDKDTNPQHKYLRRTPEAMRQGEHRLARSKAFFQAARDRAAKLKTELNWRYVIVPGVGHSNRKMAGFAAEYIAGQKD